MEETVHKHWCEVEGHWFDCAEQCVCECGLPMDGHDHSGCPVELRPCFDHLEEYERRMAEAAAISNAAVEVGDDEEEAPIPHCDCGCADVAPEDSFGFCLWCDHVYVDYSPTAEEQHFAHECPEPPEELREAARERLAQRRARSR